MKDCFALRFQLEKTANPETEDVVGAISALFSVPCNELEESVAYHEQRLSELASNVDKVLTTREKNGLQDKRIAFFGDSLTSDRWSYANIIKRLGVAKCADNYAVSCAISSQMVGRLLEKLKPNAYDIVVLFIGTNDSSLKTADYPYVTAAEFERNLRFSAEQIKNCGAKGVLFTLPHRTERTFSFGEVVTHGYNEAIRRVAEKNNLRLIEINDICLSYIEDDIHFTETTQVELAKETIKILAEI